MLRTLAGRVALLLLAWWALAEGEIASLGFGLLVAVPVGVVSLRFFAPSPYRIRPLGGLRFAGYFLYRSLIAGLDIAGRLLQPALPIRPGYCSLATTLPEGGPRWLLANTLSLLPGTLSVTLRGRQLELHCLDTRMPIAAEMRRTERHIAAMFSVAPAAAADSSP
ncbi:Na+/H+ antiporter subunit E [Haliea sp.]